MLPTDRRIRFFHVFMHRHHVSRRAFYVTARGMFIPFLQLTLHQDVNVVSAENDEIKIPAVRTAVTGRLEAFVRGQNR
jgi:hypothetical protein